ncbi:transglycosylase domain-containing protein [Chryseobacterium oryctis]|uniref:Transglycosylase domain-containing protein n=1 Tax=Chryseobacterium oryctis TaxID=2952618 RepID=A0ABT3HN63_9FLAO|nr:transglycosylase domain-containing protein [Chryseobacterium oryctis]MCW3161226.1 transglycosylase domain-containing protein [Chryseobacterium oryctis]
MKYLKIISIAFFSILVLLILYIEFGGRYILNTTDKRIITWHIRSSEQLPTNFYNFYDIVYPNSLSDNSWNLIFNTLLNPNTQRKSCPCNQLAYRLFLTLNTKNKSAIDYFLIARYIEHRYSQKDCLNFNFSNFDFLENRKGIKNISQSFFNKEAKDLRPLEMGEILALYENPVKNNRNRNPERAKTRAKYFYNLYIQNSNK